MCDKIIGVFGVPRSGTSWLGQIFNSSKNTKFSYQPMFSDKYMDCIHPRSSSDKIADYLNSIYLSEDDFLSQNDGKEKGKQMFFLKDKVDTFVFKEVMYLYMIPVFLKKLPDIKIVIIIRNPVDVLTSWYNASREFYPEWNIYEEWMFAQKKNAFLPERYYGYHRWKEAMQLTYVMKEEYPERVAVVQYEKLDINPAMIVKDLFKFVDLDYSAQTENFIIDSKSRTGDGPYSVFRNKETRYIGRKELPKDIVQLIKQDLEITMKNNKWELLRDYFDAIE